MLQQWTNCIPLTLHCAYIVLLCNYLAILVIDFVHLVVKENYFSASYL